jgi:hypothetical protein
VVAGGGGGGGVSGDPTCAAANGGQAGDSSVTGPGAGGAGTEDCASPGGAAGLGGVCPGDAGALGQGGDAPTSCDPGNSGAGGGGGYYGGGGDDGGQQGGGAGSSFWVPGATATSMTTDTTGVPEITITATTPAFPFTGFLSPVDNPPTINEVHAGQAIPIKFSLGSDQGLNILAVGYPSVQQVNCATGAPINSATETDTAGNSGLQDNGGGNYTYVWKTSKASAGTCQVFTLGLTDGTFHSADFQYAS